EALSVGTQTSRVCGVGTNGNGESLQPGPGVAHGHPTVRPALATGNRKPMAIGTVRNTRHRAGGLRDERRHELPRLDLVDPHPIQPAIRPAHGSDPTSVGLNATEKTPSTYLGSDQTSCPVSAFQIRKVLS